MLTTEIADELTDESRCRPKPLQAEALNFKAKNDDTFAIRFSLSTALNSMRYELNCAVNHVEQECRVYAKYEQWN